MCGRGISVKTMISTKHFGKDFDDAKILAEECLDVFTAFKVWELFPDDDFYAILQNRILMVKKLIGELK